MDLVYIYGPPAAGKLTVATEIARRTGFKLFHNHLTIAAVEPVFGFGTDPFWRLVHGMRESILAEAALAGISLVFTTVYNHRSRCPRHCVASRRSSSTLVACASCSSRARSRH